MRTLNLIFCAGLLWACGEDAGATDPDPGQQGALDGGAVADGGGDTPDAAPLIDDAEVLPDSGPDGGEADAAPGPQDEASGFVYEDTDDTDRSTYDHEFAGEDAPIAGLTVRLIGADGETETQTDAEGRYRFPGLDDGVYLVQPDLPEGMRCALRNCTGRFAEAVAAGSATLVVYGDSVPVVGDRPFFPTRLATLLEPLADIEVKNIAVAGSTSPQWLPGTNHYRTRLAPEIEGADLILVSIGGNDIVGYAANPAHLSDIPAAVAGAVELIADIADNIITTLAAIREINPDVDVGFLLYVDYSKADANQFWRLANTLLGAENIQLVFESALEAMPTEEGFVLVDLFNGSQDQDVNALLFDQLHFNARGQTFYAEEIFKALGGVLVGDSPLTDQPRVSLGLEQTWSFAAE